MIIHRKKTDLFFVTIADARCAADGAQYLDVDCHGSGERSETRTGLVGDRGL